ncbi:MAG: hypothetical protein K5765_04670 [Clostridia bacterium]|nr:hypothetical protein [Clostridia bacterium]
MAGGNSGSRNSNTEGGKYYDGMNIEKQNKHVPGTKEYSSNKSTIDIPIDELDKLIRENIDNAVQLPNGKMVLDLPKDIGTVINEKGESLGKTNRITIHKSKTGYHAVPAKKGNKKGGK